MASSDSGGGADGRGPGEPGRSPRAPALTVTPTSVDPGATVTVTATDCGDTQVSVDQFEEGQDVVVAIDLDSQGGGTWSTEVTAGQADTTFSVSQGCGGAQPEAIVDVENPQLFLRPNASFPESVVGTDCPVGATPDVTVYTNGNPPFSVPTPDVDASGDWFVDLFLTPVPQSTGPGRVEATCGEVAYAPVTFDIPGGPTTTTEPAPTSEAVPPVPTTAPPATPVSGAAQFTG